MLKSQQPVLTTKTGSDLNCTPTSSLPQAHAAALQSQGTPAPSSKVVPLFEELVETLQGSPEMLPKHACHGGGSVYLCIAPGHTGRRHACVLKAAGRKAMDSRGRRVAPGGIIREALVIKLAHHRWRESQGSNGLCPYVPEPVAASHSSSVSPLCDGIVPLFSGASAPEGGSQHPLRARAFGFLCRKIQGHHLKFYPSLSGCTKWSKEACLDCALGLIEAVACLHGLGIFHRDIKEANYMYVQGPPGRVVLLDFAAAFVSTENPSHGTAEAVEELWRKCLHCHMVWDDVQHLSVHHGRGRHSDRFMKEAGARGCEFPLLASPPRSRPRQPEPFVPPPRVPDVCFRVLS